MIEFCLTLCYCHDGILDVLAGKPVGKNCGNCELVKDGNKIGKVPAICTKSKSQCATQVNYASLKQGQLQRWTEHSTLIFENLKPVEISKKISNII